MFRKVFFPKVEKSRRHFSLSRRRRKDCLCALGKERKPVGIISVLLPFRDCATTFLKILLEGQTLLWPGSFQMSVLGWGGAAETCNCISV